MPRSGSKRSQEGFARDKPSETSRKEIKDASHRVSFDSAVPLRTSAASSWPEGGRGAEEEEGEKEEMEEDDEKEMGGKEGSPFNYPTLNSLSG